MTLIQLATQTQASLDEAVARIAELSAEQETAIAAKDETIATLQASYDEKVAYQTMMETRVTEVILSGDRVQYEALAAEFLAPAKELARLKKLARVKELKDEAAALEAELAE